MVKKILLLSLYVNVISIVIAYQIWDEWNREKLISGLQEAQRLMTGRQDMAYLENKARIYDALPASDSDIVFVGTSRTEGFPVADLFPTLKIKNRGIAGNEAPQIVQRLGSFHKARLIFLEYGINDIKNGASIGDFIQSSDTILSQLKSSGARIIVESILPTCGDYDILNEKIKMANENLRLLCEIYHLEFLDMSRDFKMDASQSYDGVHLTLAGYYQWKKWLDPYFAKHSN